MNLLVTLLFAQLSWSQQVVEVRRNIPLSESEPVYKDFYINTGTAASQFKTGQILVAHRKVMVRDASGSTQVGEMRVPVGELKIISIFEKVTVAREVKLFDRQDLPMLEQRAIMTGDDVEIKK